ncbi:MAG: hypothetical protein PHE06_06875 [Lachnospiraceae bacterium]|nr:hypothetical protein [Lachnospiraceae bacterium]
MSQVIKRQFVVQWKDWMWGMGSVGGISLIVFCVIQLIVHFTDMSYQQFVSIGTTFGCVVAVFYALVIEIQVGYYFNLEISMGCTRKHFFLAFYLVNLVFGLLTLVLLSAICMAEMGLNRLLHPGVESMFNILPHFPSIGIGVAAALPMVCGFAGALNMRFGKKAFWVLWGIWMFAWIGIPQISEAAENAPGSIFGRIGNGVSALLKMVPGNIWIVLAVTSSLACFAGSFLILRKQAVTA